MKVSEEVAYLIRSGVLSCSEAKYQYNISSTYFYNILYKRARRPSFDKLFAKLMKEQAFTRITCDKEVTYLFKRKRLILLGFNILAGSSATFNINVQQKNELAELKSQLRKLYD